MFMKNYGLYAWIYGAMYDKVWKDCINYWWRYKQWKDEQHWQCHHGQQKRRWTVLFPRIWDHDILILPIITYYKELCLEFNRCATECLMGEDKWPFKNCLHVEK